MFSLTDVRANLLMHGLLEILRVDNGTDLEKLVFFNVKSRHVASLDAMINLARDTNVL